MTIVTMTNDYRRETGEERIARFNALAESEYTKTICNQCGTKLDARGHCPHGCLDNSISTAIIRAYAKPAQQVQPVKRCPICFCEIGACEHTAPIESMNAGHISCGGLSL